MELGLIFVIMHISPTNHNLKNNVNVAFLGVSLCFHRKCPVCTFSSLCTGKCYLAKIKVYLYIHGISP